MHIEHRRRPNGTRWFMAATAAAVVVAVSTLAGPVTPAAATTCSFVTVGSPAHIYVFNELAATLKQVYCAANRSAYAELDISQAWYNEGHRGWDVRMHVDEPDITGSCASSTGSVYNNVSYTLFRDSALSIDSACHPEKEFYVWIDFKYNTCYVGRYFGGDGQFLAFTNDHLYSNGTNSGTPTDALDCD
jgi:hypothetical protein